MNHITTILKIIDHALTGNVDAVKAYGYLLADKLEEDGCISQSKLLRDRVSSKPVPPEQIAMPCSPVGTVSLDTLAARKKEQANAFRASREDAGLTKKANDAVEAIKAANRAKNEEDLKRKVVHLETLKKALTDYLATSYTFTRPVKIGGVEVFRPLALNTQRVLCGWVYKQPIAKNVSNAVIKLAIGDILGRHVNAHKYIRGLIACNTRFDLDGNPVGDISPENKRWAMLKLGSAPAK